MVVMVVAMGFMIMTMSMVMAMVMMMLMFMSVTAKCVQETLPKPSFIAVNVGFLALQDSSFYLVGSWFGAATFPTHIKRSPVKLVPIQFHGAIDRSADGNAGIRTAGLAP